MFRAILQYACSFSIVQWALTKTKFRVDSHGRVFKCVRTCKLITYCDKPILYYDSYPTQSNTPPWDVVYDERQQYFTIVHAPTGTVVAVNLYYHKAEEKARWLSEDWPLPVLHGVMEDEEHYLAGYSCWEVLHRNIPPECRP